MEITSDVDITGNNYRQNTGNKYRQKYVSIQVRLKEKTEKRPVLLAGAIEFQLTGNTCV